MAAAVFLHQGRQALYKFGASDYGFQHLRPNNLVMWEGIRQCAARGCGRLHFGRTSLANEGLRRFKLGFGAREEEIKYCKYDFRAGRFVTDVDRAEGWFNRVFRLSAAALVAAGGPTALSASVLRSKARGNKATVHHGVLSRLM